MALAKIRDGAAIPSLNGTEVLEIDNLTSTDYKVSVQQVEEYTNAGKAGGKTIEGGQLTGETLTLHNNSVDQEGPTIGENGGITDTHSIDFQLSVVTAIQEGREQWDPETGTLIIGLPGGAAYLPIGQGEILPKRPRAIGGDVNEGKFVYMSGATGAVPEVSLAGALDFTNACGTLACSIKDVLENQRGNYATFGLKDNVDTSGISVGSTIWLSTTPGEFTKDRPPAPACSVRLGYVIYEHATEGVILVSIDVERDLVVRDITKEPTGFFEPQNVDESYNSTTRKVTLTGTVNGYYRGVPVSIITDGWVSDAHVDVAGEYFLLYDGTSISWKTPANAEFSDLLISIVHYGAVDRFGIRECHGFLAHEAHRIDHKEIGTYRDSGGEIQDYLIESTTPADRRPSVGVTELWDEDLPTTLLALVANGPYTQFFLSGAEVINFNKTALDIIPLIGNDPYFNELVGSTWQQTIMTNNYYMSIWLYAIPVTSDSESQEYRFIFLQGQNQSSSIETQKALVPENLQLSALKEFTPEFIAITQFIIRYIGGNWYLAIKPITLGGSRSSQTGVPGSGLSVVATDTTLTGNGTTSDPLGVAEILLEDTGADLTPVDIRNVRIAEDQSYFIAKTTSTLDQSQAGGSNQSTSTDLWQSVTQGITGNLVLVKIWFTQVTASDTVIRIYSDEGTGGVLLSTVPATSYGTGLQSIVLPTPPYLEVGAVFTIRANSSASLYWKFNISGGYSGGRFSTSALADGVFETYVLETLFAAWKDGIAVVATTMKLIAQNAAGTSTIDLQNDAPGEITQLKLNSGSVAIQAFSNDPDFSGDSATTAVTQHAVKVFVEDNVPHNLLSQNFTTLTTVPALVSWNIAKNTFYKVMLEAPGFKSVIFWLEVSYNPTVPELLTCLPNNVALYSSVNGNIGYTNVSGRDVYNIGINGYTPNFYLKINRSDGVMTINTVAGTAAGTTKLSMVPTSME